MREEGQSGCARGGACCGPGLICPGVPLSDGEEHTQSTSSRGKPAGGLGALLSLFGRGLPLGLRAAACFDSGSAPSRENRRVQC